MPEIIKAESGEFEAFLSVIHKGNWWSPLPAHIPIFVDYAMTPKNTVASAVPYFDEDGWLRVKGRFANTSWAEEIRSRVESGEIDLMQDQSFASESSHFHRVLLSGTFVTPQLEER
jgi:hypothetical protein